MHTFQRHRHKACWAFSNLHRARAPRAMRCMVVAACSTWVTLRAGPGDVSQCPSSKLEQARCQGSATVELQRGPSLYPVVAAAARRAHGQQEYDEDWLGWDQRRNGWGGIWLEMASMGYSASFVMTSPWSRKSLASSLRRSSIPCNTKSTPPSMHPRCPAIHCTEELGGLSSACSRDRL